jgi:methionyl-tRNA synthetase
MLDALRRSVGSWVVKAFIGVIMLSFAVWGVSDVFRGYRGAEVARVGDTDFSEARLVASHDLELSNGLGNLVNRTVSLVHKLRSGRVHPVRPADPQLGDDELLGQPSPVFPRLAGLVPVAV